jgi:hypothetical protein
MSNSDAKNNKDDLSLLTDLDEVGLSDESTPDLPTDDGGMDLMLSDEELESGDDASLGDDADEESVGENEDDEGLELNLSDDMESSLGLEEAPLENLGELDFSDTPDLPLSDDLASPGLSLADDLSAGDDVLNDMSVDFGATDGLEDSDLSEDAKRKLKEIDEIMESSSSQINIHMNLGAKSAKDDDSSPSLDKPLVSDDLNLDDLDFSREIAQEAEDEKPKKKKKEREEAPRETTTASTRAMSSDLKEISGAYTAEMERSFATISNLRSDREELLAKIQNMEEDKILHNRQSLTLRAELDEKKIELSIVRKKLNEEVNELKDRMKFHDERKLILEEKNRILTVELEKSTQRNKMDVKKVQMRERELEQTLELLKSDAETQIRHRDLKILELKRKIDAMEFDMESIQVQEKKSVESRFELEDKLDKAIKTLRSAITVLEEESDRESAVMALKKNIDV